MRQENKLILWRCLAAFIVVYALAAHVSAGYLGPVILFIVNRLIPAFTMMGYSIAVVMFAYGAIRYAYTADDPGGRKQAMGICIASVVAIIIIRIAWMVIFSIPIT